MSGTVINADLVSQKLEKFQADLTDCFAKKYFIYKIREPLGIRKLTAE
jgi:hypothetical protein